MVLFKRIVSGLLYPLPLSLLIILAGLLLLWFTRRQTAGKVAVSVGFALLLVSSYWPAATALIAPLESANAAVVDAADPALPKRILLLNGGVIADATHPAASQLGDATLARLVEAVRLLHAIPDSRLYITATDAGTGAAIRRAAQDLGIAADRLVSVPTGGDTAGEAAALKPLLGTEPFLLVTSAAHMERALATYRALGMIPVPAPADFRALRREGFPLDFLLPNERALVISTRAVHEYLGGIWRRFGGN